MRIVSWNCGGGFQKKASGILELEPDFLVIQEVTQDDALRVDARFVRWVGAPGRKGMAVFNFTDHPCTVDDADLSNLWWFIPVRWNGLSILACWACKMTNSRRYVRVMHEAIDRYTGFLDPTSSIVIGDLNSSTVFDKKHSRASHTHLVERLGAMGLTSAYHHLIGEIHGEESEPTFFLYRHEDRAYHLDYAFVSNPLLERSQITLGPSAHWLQVSDHVPLILDLSDSPSMLRAGS